MVYYSWDDEQEQILKEMFVDGYTDQEIADYLNEKYGYNRKAKAIESKRRILGLLNYRQQKWTEEEDDFLRYAEEKGLSIEEMQEKLNNRTKKAISVRRRNLGLADKIPQRKWSESEEKKLKELVENGVGINVICEKLDRKKTSIMPKKQELGLTKSYNTWSNKETEKLKSLVKKGFTNKQIADKMDRTVQSIIGKRKREL